jgi:hypothetical protein
MLGKKVEKQKVEILKMVETTKGRIAKCRNYLPRYFSKFWVGGWQLLPVAQSWAG